MIIDILEALKGLVENYCNANGIDCVVSIMPDATAINNDKWYFFVDIDEINYVKNTSISVGATYDIKIGIAKRVNNYREFISGISLFIDELCRHIMTTIAVTQLTIGEYGYDEVNKVGALSIVAKVGVE